MLLSKWVFVCAMDGNRSPLPTAAPSGYRLTSPALSITRSLFYKRLYSLLWSIWQAKSATIILIVYLWFVVCVAQLKTVLCCDGMRINLYINENVCVCIYIYLKCVLTGWRVCVMFSVSLTPILIISFLLRLS